MEASGPIEQPHVRPVWGFCGGSGSGKSTMCQRMYARLGTAGVAVLPFDSYYLDHGHLTVEERRLVDYDRPASLDHELYVAHLLELRAGRPADVPVYDFATHTRTGEVTRVEPAPVVIAEGILILAVAEVRGVLDWSVFLDVGPDLRLERRLARDVVERGRDADDVRRQVAATVEPAYVELVAPSAVHADVVLAPDADRDTFADELCARLMSEVDR